MRTLNMFSRLCAIFALLVCTSFFAETRMGKAYGHELSYLDDKELDEMEADSSSLVAVDSSALYFSLPLFEDTEAEQERIGSEYKRQLLSVLPAALREKASAVEIGNFLTIAQIVNYGKGNFPKTEWNMFRYEVWCIAVRLRKDYKIPVKDLQLYDWIMKTFRIESGFRSDVKNRMGSAAGIFQVTASNRKRLGFPSNWVKLSPIEQLPWYDVYVRHHLSAGYIDPTKIEDRCDFYMINFMPAYASSPDSKCIARACGGTCKKYGKKKHYCAYHANTAFDLDKDGAIYKREVAALLNKKFEQKSKSNKNIGNAGKGNGLTPVMSYNVNVMISEHLDMLSYSVKMPLTNLSISLP